jgi:hypothetical protein
VYSFNEPEVVETSQEVTLIREGGRPSEQSFLVTVNVGGPDSGLRSATRATPEQSGDYGVGGESTFIFVLFPSSALSVPLPLQFFPDDSPEGLEAFRATANPTEGFPNFRPPALGLAFATTEVQITDNDGKSTCTDVNSVTVFCCFSNMYSCSCQIYTAHLYHQRNKSLNSGVRESI